MFSGLPFSGDAFSAFRLPASGAETITEDKWHQGLSTPIRRAGLAVALIAASGAVISPWALTRAEAVTVDRWLQPLSEPKIKNIGRLGLPVQEQPFFAFVKATPFPEAVHTDAWMRALDEPIIKRIRIELPTREQSFLAFVAPVTPAEIVTVDKWYAPFREPVRTKPGLLAAANEDLFLGAPPIVPGTFPPLSEPVRYRSFATALQQIPTQNPWGLTRPEAVSVDRWGQPLSSPIFAKRLSTAQQQAIAFGAAPIVNPAPPMASWNFEWITPVRFLVGHTPLAAQQGTVMPIIPIPNPPPAPGVYTVSGLYVIDQFTDNTVVYDYSGGVSHRTN